VPLMDMGLRCHVLLARHRRPHIWFLLIGSRVCSAVPSDPISRSAPLRFSNRLPPSGPAGDFHPKLFIMLGTHQKCPAYARPSDADSSWQPVLL